MMVKTRIVPENVEACQFETQPQGKQTWFAGKSPIYFDDLPIAMLIFHSKTVDLHPAKKR